MKSLISSSHWTRVCAGFLSLRLSYTQCIDKVRLHGVWESTKKAIYRRRHHHHHCSYYCCISCSFSCSNAITVNQLFNRDCGRFNRVLYFILYTPVPSYGALSSHPFFSNYQWIAIWQVLSPLPPHNRHTPPVSLSLFCQCRHLQLFPCHECWSPVTHFKQWSECEREKLQSKWLEFSLSLLSSTLLTRWVCLDKCDHTQSNRVLHIGPLLFWISLKMQANECHLNNWHHPTISLEQ